VTVAIRKKMKKNFKNIKKARVFPSKKLLKILLEWDCCHTGRGDFGEK